MAIDFSFRAVNTAISVTGALCETVDIYDDYARGTNTQTSLGAQATALGCRIVAQISGSNAVKTVLKTCEAGARMLSLATYILGADSSNDTSLKGVGLAAGILRSVAELEVLGEQDNQACALKDPTLTVSETKSTCEIKVNPNGQNSGIPFINVCTYTTEEKPFNLANSLHNEQKAALFATACSVGEAAALTSKTVVNYRDIGFGPAGAIPAPPALVVIPPTKVPRPDPHPDCPITHEPIDEPCRDRRHPRHFYEKQPLTTWVGRNHNNPLTREPMTTGHIEPVIFI